MLGSVRRLYQQRPLLANSTIGFCVFTAGDVAAQCADGVRASTAPSSTDVPSGSGGSNAGGDGDGGSGGDSTAIDCERAAIDWGRAAGVGVLGIALNGFVLHGWYRVLDRVFGAKLNRWASVLPKVVADQAVYAPIACGSFLAWAAVLKGGSSAEEVAANARRNLEHSFVPLWMADCCVWPFANLIGFRFVPTNYRPSYIGVVQLCWQSYMSSIGHEHVADHPSAAEESAGSAIIIASA